MTLLLHDGTHNNGLFDVLGLCFFAFDTLNTALASTVPTEVVEFLSQAELITGGAGQPAVSTAVAAVAGVPNATSQWQGNSAALAAGLQAAAVNLLLAYTQADNTSLGNKLSDNLNYLVAQMTAGTVTGGDHVTAATPTIAVAAGSNTGDVALVATLTGGNGQIQQNALAETLSLSVSSTGLVPQLYVTSPNAVPNRLSYLWPGGSGLAASLTAIDSQNSLLANGSFETDTIANYPDGWILATATPNTTLFVTGQCVQSVTIGSSPTGGSYVLCWVDQAGINRATAPLAWNATQGQVQSALQAIAGLGQVTVATTGVGPNYTHTITFWGLGGAVSTLTALSQLTGGTPTITPAVVTAADANTFNGQALQLVGDGSQLTTIYNPLSGLAANTTYFLGFRARVKSGDTVLAGSLHIDVVNAIGGSVVSDAAGTANSLVVNLTTLSNSAWTFFSLGFRIPPTVVQPVYLRLQLATAITSGKTVYLDSMAIGEGVELYSGGPIVAAFNGRLPAGPNDTWTVTVTNAMAGKFQKDFNRFFGMADLGLLLPTAGSVGLLNDSLVT